MMILNRRRVAGYLLLLAGLAGPAAVTAAADRPGLDQAIGETLAGHPALAQKRAQAEAMATQPDQAGSLPDPRLSLNLLNLPVDSFALSQEPMTQLQLGISQALPYPGKLALRRSSAEARSRAAALAVDELRLQLTQQVRGAWWQLAYLDRALLIVERNRVLLRQFVAVAQTKYTVGDGLQQDVLLAQLELSRLREQELELQGKRRHAEVALNRLMSRPEQQAISLPEVIDEGLPEIPPEAGLQALALEQPLLNRRQQELAAAHQQLALARKDTRPDFTLGASYGLRQGNNADGSERADFASVTLSVNLPLYADSKQRRAIDQRNSELLANRFALQDARAQVAAEVAQAHSDYLSAREQTALYKGGIIPQARQAVASMLAGYRANKVDFLKLIQTQITLHKYETQYWRSLSEARQALARLSAAVGQDVREGEQP